MKLNAKDLKAAAAAARELAAEYANGRECTLNPNSYCACAAHEIAIRAGLNGSDSMDIAYVLPFGQYDTDVRFANLISEATWHATRTHLGGAALVFPLLAWADAADLAAEPPSSASASLAGHEQDKEEM